jgi:gamma-glutamylcyclotransferase (GGCT)/AIG2-like uncharacterized protein YtfP
MYYFAYGMNTNKKSMADRCPESIDFGAADLQGYSLSFKYHCDIDPDENEFVRGVLWKITDRCIEQLDHLEGLGSYYNRKVVLVEHPDLGTVKALVYYMIGRNNYDYPNEHYYMLVSDGYLKHGIDPKLLELALDKIES